MSDFQISASAQIDVQQDLLDGGSSYGAIMADPPWQFATRSERGRDRSPDGFAFVEAAPLLDEPGEAGDVRHYPTMTTDEICALPVGPRAAKDCALFLWVSSPMLEDGLRVGRAWGFEFKTVAFVWAKVKPSGWDGALAPDKIFPIGTGYWTRANPELCLLFTRGAPKRKSAAVRQLVIAPRREHSRKPDEIRRSIERLVDGPYLEMFARQKAEGWDAFGNQTDKFEADQPQRAQA